MKKTSRQGKTIATSSMNPMPRRKRKDKNGSRHVKMLKRDLHTESPTFKLSRPGTARSAMSFSMGFLCFFAPMAWFNACSSFLVESTPSLTMNVRSSNNRFVFF